MESVLACHELLRLLNMLPCAWLQLRCMWHAAPLPTMSPGASYSNSAMRSMLVEEAQAARLEARAKVCFTTTLAPSLVTTIQIICSTMFSHQHY